MQDAKDGELKNAGALAAHTLPHLAFGTPLSSGVTVLTLPLVTGQLEPSARCIDVIHRHDMRCTIMRQVRAIMVVGCRAMTSQV
jgi:hypothetical protein